MACNSHVIKPQIHFYFNLIFCYLIFQHSKLSLGCPILDDAFRGGLLLPGINEISGESGSGKTQVALQLCLTVQLSEENGGLQGGIQ